MMTPSEAHLVIETPRLRLQAGTAEITKLAVTDRQQFGQALTATVPDEWPQELMRDAEPWIADKMASDPGSAGWWVWYVILKSPEGDILIGTAGLKGRPQPDGTVEVGYGILEPWQQRGFATEATLAVMDWAWSHPEVTRVVAETYRHLIASIRTMKKCGMNFVGPGSEDGVIRYGVSRESRDRNSSTANLF